MELTEAGAHMDSVNAQGETPFEAATTGKSMIIHIFIPIYTKIESSSSFCNT